MAQRPRQPNGPRRRAVYTRVVFPQYTDQDLAAVDFRILDPLALPNRTDEEPPLDQTIEFVGHYTTDRMIKCVFGHGHKTGFVFRDEAGRHYLVGHTCGANVMGADEWQVVVGRSKDIRERAGYLRQIRALREVLERHREWLFALPTLPPIAAMARLRHALRQRRDFFYEARSAFTFNEGRINGTRRMRDIEAEERRETREEVEIARFGTLNEMDKVRYLRQRREPKITITHIYTNQVVPLGVIVGKTLFCRPASESAALDEVAARLFDLLPVDTDQVQTTELKRRSKQVRALLDGLEQIRLDVREAIAFFEQENIDRITVWANGRGFDNSVYTAETNALRIADNERDINLLIERPAALVPIEDPIFAEIQEARLAFARALDAPGL